jgi:nucleoside-diphosphate-sugar epimerase
LSADRFERQVDRRLAPDLGALRGIEGNVVLVTGGTGCIGSVLLEELQSLGARRVVSLSRGARAAETHVGSVEYQDCDIRDNAMLHQAFARVRPDVVFHLAAQRDPGLAERTVPETLDTNINGVRNVISASLHAGVQVLVYASTGKALRPFTPHVYAASKKIGELLAFVSAQESEMRVGIARFTHVVNNSLVLRRFRSVPDGDVLRVHDPYTQFYSQSAREAAQLLLWANTNAFANGDVDVVAIRDLGMPTDLLDLALAVASESRVLRPIYIAGNEAGYEDSYYPGLYDPETATDVTPLLNSFEAAHVRDLGDAEIDASPISILNHDETRDRLALLDIALREHADEARLREALDAVSMSLLEATVESVAPALLERLLRLTTPWRGEMSGTDLAIDDCLRRKAGWEAPLVDG